MDDDTHNQGILQALLGGAQDAYSQYQAMPSWLDQAKSIPPVDVNNIGASARDPRAQQFAMAMAGPTEMRGVGADILPFTPKARTGPLSVPPPGGGQVVPFSSSAKFDPRLSHQPNDILDLTPNIHPTWGDRLSDPATQALAQGRAIPDPKNSSLMSPTSPTSPSLQDLMGTNHGGQNSWDPNYVPGGATRGPQPWDKIDKQGFSPTTNLGDAASLGVPLAGAGGSLAALKAYFDNQDQKQSTANWQP